MPLVLSDYWEDPQVRLLIWDIQEPEDFFTGRLVLPPTELAYISTLKAEKRRLQSLATRFIVQEQLGTEALSLLRRDEFGRPYLENSPWQVGFSHTQYISGVVVSPTRVGIDIQRYDERIPRYAALRFASAYEKSLMKVETAFNHYHVIWGLKEAIYKACNLRGVHFIDHLRSEPFVYQPQGGYVKACVDMPGAPRQNYLAAYFNWQGHMVVMAAEQPHLVVHA